VNRRDFFRLLAGAGTVYVFAPRGGWRLDRGVWASNGSPVDVGWSDKTAEEILADVARYRLFEGGRGGGKSARQVFLTRRLEAADFRLTGTSG
jgi:hypothetical protein